jgi:hypothetical protein
MPSIGDTRHVHTAFRLALGITQQCGISSALCRETPESGFNLVGPTRPRFTHIRCNWTPTVRLVTISKLNDSAALPELSPPFDKTWYEVGGLFVKAYAGPGSQTETRQSRSPVHRAPQTSCRVPRDLATEQTVVAWLHEVIEDTNETNDSDVTLEHVKDAFGPQVCAALDTITKRPSEKANIDD